MAFIVDQKSEVGNFVSSRNRARQFDFLQTSYVVSAHAGGLEIDHEFICTLNAYATRYISPQPGRYRRHYNVMVGQHNPSHWSLVYEEMEGFIDTLHKNWAKWTPFEASAYTLWGVNHVHPFCEGNGRTARALSYYVLCLKLGQWLPGSTTVLELIRLQHREYYCDILQRMHDGRQRPSMMTDLAEMTTLITNLVREQVAIAQQEIAARGAEPSSGASAADPSA